MNERDDDSYPTTEYLAGLRTAAIFYLVGGVILFFLRFAAARMPIAFVAGALILALGIGWLMANNPINKKMGLMIIGIGVLVVLAGIPSPVMKMVVGVLISIVTTAFFALGIKNLIMYIFAQRKRY